jgi:hypothetical protein
MIRSRTRAIVLANVVAGLDNPRAIDYIINSPGRPGEAGKEEPRVEVQVKRVVVAEGSTVALLFGQPTDDSTKVIVAALDRRQAFDLAEFASQVDGPVVVDVPDWAVLAVLELP